MPKILLDYTFPISVIETIAAASTAYLKQVCIVAKPKSGQEGNVGELYLCTSAAQVAVRTDNVNATQFFSAGMSRVYILLADDLDLADFLEEHGQEFYTLFISDDFDDDEIAGAKATGVVTISDYAALVSGTDDALAVAGVSFVAQTGAATLGQSTFQAATSDEATATSLAAQINAHATAGALVTASVVGDAVTITAKARGLTGNDIAVAYTDNDTNVGLSLSGLSGGKLSGGTAAMDIGAFEGVVGIAAEDRDVAEDYAVMEKHAAFFTISANGAKNAAYAFGKLLANPSQWRNQQYIAMPANDGVTALGDALSLFDDRISFVLNDDEYSNRLAFFGAGGKAIVAPYISKNLRVDLQGAALQWIAANQPQYTKAWATLLETRLQEDVINSYIARGWIEAGVISVDIVNDNFVATGEINIAEPKALWRVENEMLQTL